MANARSTGKVSKASGEGIIIPVDDMLAGIEQLQSESPEGFSTHELAVALGISKSAAGVRLTTLYDLGLIECSGRRNILRRDGVAGKIPVYKYVKKAVITATL